MPLSHALFLPFVLGLVFAPRAASSLCTLLYTDPRCVCATQVLEQPAGLLLCLEAAELELRDGNLSRLVVDPSYLPHLQAIRVTTLIFTNVSMTFDFLTDFLFLLDGLKVKRVTVRSSTISGPVQQLEIPVLPEQSKIKHLQLEDVNVASSLLHPSLLKVHQWLFEPLESLALVRAGLANVECYWADLGRRLCEVDLSENPLSWSGLQNVSRCPSLVFQRLQTVGLRNSGLTSLQPPCPLLDLAPKLATLDLSRNRLSDDPVMSPGSRDRLKCLQGMESLRVLNLSHSSLAAVNVSFPKSLEVLDLSGNSLETFRGPPKGLKQLLLSNNRLSHLPVTAAGPQLEVLDVSSNRLRLLVDEEGGVTREQLEKLDVLRAGGNPYRCDCSLRDTLLFLTDAHTVPDWPEEFVCGSPEAMEGTHVIEASLGGCEKPNGGTRASTAGPLSAALCWLLHLLALL